MDKAVTLAIKGSTPDTMWYLTEMGCDILEGKSIVEISDGVESSPKTLKRRPNDSTNN